jgi:hypothetical protein
MTYVALRYSDPIAMRWGPVALLFGLLVYGMVRMRGMRPAHRAGKAD